VSVEAYSAADPGCVRVGVHAREKRSEMGEHGLPLGPKCTSSFFLLFMRCLYLAAPARPGLSLVVRSVRPAAPRRPGGVHLPVRPTTPRRSLSARAATDDDAPSTAREAIDAGIARLDAGDADGSLALFTQALTLPGRGLKRFR